MASTLGGDVPTLSAEHMLPQKVVAMVREMPLEAPIKLSLVQQMRLLLLRLRRQKSVRTVRWTAFSGLLVIFGFLWYLQYQPREYTLQLMSGRNRGAIETYIKQHHLGQLAQLVQTRYHHKNWYELSYGHYANLSDAKKALRQLPADIKSRHPWVCPVASSHHA